MCYRTYFTFKKILKINFWKKWKKIIFYFWNKWKIFFFYFWNKWEKKYFLFLARMEKKKEKKSIAKQGEQNNLGVDVYNNLSQSSLSERVLVLQQSKIRCGC
jgi:hypothetical protein